MFFTESNVLIKAPIDMVYRAVKDVTKWPGIFPPCQSVEILREEGRTIEIRLSALTKGKLFSWTSIRINDEINKSVKFQQIETAKPLSFMSGEWICESKGNQTKVRLTHTFDLEYKWFRGVMAFVAKRFFIDANSERELKGLKDYMERRQD